MLKKKKGDGAQWELVEEKEMEGAVGVGRKDERKWRRGWKMGVGG